MNVSQLMNRNVDTCRPTDTLAAAASRMWEADIGCLVVVGEDGKVLGMVTDRDACMAAYTQGRPLHEIPVSVAMSREIYSCGPNDSLIEAEEVMRSRKVRRLPVLDADAKLVGIVSLNDLALESERESGRKGRQVSGQEISATLAAICEPRSKRRALTVAA
jgi:CBS domain-containing protein